MSAAAILVQYVALIIAVFMWAMASFYLMKVAAAYFSGRAGRASVLLAIAFKVAVLVVAGVYVIHIGDLIAGVL